ncbi:MAG: hypothetical protein IMY84_03940 [Chloroflexi bacterium]|nr:hypothetical protein [Chloroflexota bacterium]
MNCAECGSALLLDRVIFRCSCGAYVHAYCADHHVVHAHRPEFQEGYVDLNGDFHMKMESEAAANLAAPEAEAESPEIVEASAEGGQDDKVEQEGEGIATVTEAPSDEGEGEGEGEPSESVKQDASSE